MTNNTSQRYQRYFQNNYYSRELRPYRRVRRGQREFAYYEYIPNSRALYPERSDFVYGRRTIIPDRPQGIFGYFFGGGWAFGQVENPTFRYTADSVRRYRELQPGANGTATFTVEYRAGDPDGIQAGVIDLDAGQEIPVDIPEGEYLLVRQTKTVGGPSGDMPFFNDLAPADKAAVFHDWKLRENDENLWNDQISKAEHDVWFYNWNAVLEVDLRAIDFDQLNSELDTAQSEFDSVANYQKAKSLLAYQESIVRFTIAIFELDGARIITGQDIPSDRLSNGSPLLVLAAAVPTDPAYILFEQIAQEVAQERGVTTEEIKEQLQLELQSNDRNNVDWAGLGAILGSSLGNILFEDEASQIVGSAFLGAFGANLAKNIGDNKDLVGSIGNALSDTLDPTGIAQTFAGAAVGTISSLLTLELSNALGLDGDIGDVFSIGFGSVANRVLNNVIFTGDINKAFEGLTNLDEFFKTPVVDNAGNVSGGTGAFAVTAVASFLGAKLGSYIVAPETQAGAVLSSIGSAVGSWAFSTVGVIGSSISSSSWLVGNAILPGVGALVGFVLGALIGNLFGKKKPKIPSADAETVLNIDSGYYELGAVSRSNGGNIDLVRDMAEAARDTLNGIIGFVTYGSDVANVANTYSPTQTYGHTASQIWVKIGSSTHNFDTPDEAIDYGSMWALRQTKIVGGDIFTKRAIYKTNATNIPALLGDIQIADDYSFYWANRDAINTLIAEPYNSLSASDKLFYDNNQDRIGKVMLAPRAEDGTFISDGTALTLSTADQNWYNQNKTTIDRILEGLNTNHVGAGWLTTLQRAAELGLNQTSRSDFYGGFGGFSDSLQILAGNSQPDLAHEDLILNLDGSTLNVDYGYGTGPTSNLMRGGDLSLGADMFRFYDNEGGGSLNIEEVDGQRALVIRDTGYRTYESGTHYANYFHFENGTTISNRHHAVEAGQTISISFDSKNLGTDSARGRMVVYFNNDAGEQVHYRWIYSAVNGHEWDRYSGQFEVPQGATQVRFAMLTYGRTGTSGVVPTNTEIAYRNFQFTLSDTAYTEIPGYSAPVYERFALDNFFAGGGFAQMSTDALTFANATGYGLALSQLQQQLQIGGESSLGEIYSSNFMGGSANARPNSHGNDLYINQTSANQIVDDTHTETWFFNFELINNDPGGWQEPTITIGEDRFETITVTVSGGDDVFITGAGDDTLYGRDGHDWLDGGAGNDVIYGGDGNDVLLGRGGTDRLYGEDGDDYIAAGTDRDYNVQIDGVWHARGAWGGNGNDTLVGSSGESWLRGDNGDDVLIVSGVGQGLPWSRYDGGAGSDTLSFERLSGAVNIDLTAIYYNGDAASPWHTFWGNQHFQSIESLTGSNYHDTLTGNGSANKLRGLAGDDSLHGGNGNDTLEGGLGADYLDGGNNRDVATYENSYSAVWVDLDLKEAFGGEAEGDTFATYSSGYTRIYDLIGSDYADTFKGNGTNNYFWGGKGDDWFISTAGSDRFFGEEDFDTVDYSEFSSAVNVNLSNSTGYWAAAGQKLYDIEHVVGTDFNDSLYGRASKDDYFTGGKGNDYLSGNTGNDTYIYNSGDGFDTIQETEFGGGYDVLVFGEGIRWNDLRFGIPSSQNLEITFAGTSGKITINRQYYDNRWEEGPIDGFDVGGVGTLDISSLTWMGNSGSTVMTIGSNSANTMRGNANKSDFFQGFAGNDVIYTWHYGASTETYGNFIIAGRGNDIIHAGTGDDQYVYELGDGADTIYDKGGADSILFGPDVSADDLIFKVSGSSLFIGLRDYNDPDKEAHQVVDRIELKNAIAGSNFAYGLIEYITAGGVDIDITKIDLGLGSGSSGGGSGGGGSSGGGSGGGGGDPFPPPDDPFDPFGPGGGFIPPIAIDLNNDGLDLISVDESRVVFQSDSGGPLFRVGWLGASDAWLAFDRNGNGVIDNLSEISFVNDLEGATTDLEALAAYDTNENGAFDAGDEMWTSFSLWQDANTNGFGGAAELTSLDEAGITSISLALTPTGSETENSGDIVSLNVAEVIYSDGSSTYAHDIAMMARLAHVASLAFGVSRPEWSDFDFTADGRFGLAVQDLEVLDGEGALTADALAVLGAFDLTPENAEELLPAQDFSFLQDVDEQISTWEGPAENPDDPQTETFGIAPVVIDMTGNGIDLVNPSQSPLEFDANGDGGLDRIGWVTPEDAILGLDRNGDGLIELVSEISFVNDLEGATTDLEGLRAFDTNSNGWLDAGDDRFGDFRIWQDSDFNAASAEGELQTLLEAGVQEISLTRDDTTADDTGPLGNLIHGTSTVIWSDGSTGIAGDVELRAFNGDAQEDAIDTALRQAAADRALNSAFAFDPSQRRTALNELAAQEIDQEAFGGENNESSLAASTFGSKRGGDNTKRIGHNGVSLVAHETTDQPNFNSFNSETQREPRLPASSSGNISNGSGSSEVKTTSDRWWLSGLSGETVGYGAADKSLTHLLDELDFEREVSGRGGHSVKDEILPEADVQALAEQQKLLQAIASFRGSSGASTLQRAGATQDSPYERLAASSISKFGAGSTAI